MRKILYPFVGVFTFLFLSPSSAFAQIFRPPVPAAQAQANDAQMNEAFNNDVAAAGSAPQAPPPEDSDSASASGLPPTPEVTASFSQPSSANDLPPPLPDGQAQNMENQASAQQTYAQENQAQADAVRAQKAQEQTDSAYAAQQSAIAQGQNPEGLSAPPAQGSPEYTGAITGQNSALNPAANAAP